ncbi:hypothetical protein ASZ90_011755 [hydrocarbon metagenome]|uniref:Uncharacterized protein n=1 Tax=hydrocarbon metagenome TaxID=938273 RepID=A0A0W8FCC6_9ZZZZ
MLAIIFGRIQGSLFPWFIPISSSFHHNFSSFHFQAKEKRDGPSAR